MIVLDANVVSELMRSAPSPVVVGWVRGHEVHELQTTAITVAQGSMLATYNAKDFEGTGVTLTDPWAD